MRFGLAAKLSLLAAGLVFLTAYATSTLFYRGARVVVRGREAAGLRDEAELRRRELLDDLERAPADLIALAGSATARAILTTPTDPDARQRLARFAGRMLTARPHYTEVVVVAAPDLREVGRVDRTPEGPSTAQPTAFRSWQGRPDLALSRGLAPGGVGFSDVRAGVASQLEQVLVSPVAGADGHTFGWVFLRVDFTPLAARISQSPRLLGFLVDADGQYLAHPDPARVLAGRGDDPLDQAFARLRERTAEGKAADVGEQLDHLTLPRLDVFAAAARFATPPDPARLRQARDAVVRKHPGLRAGRGDDSPLRLDLRGGDEVNLRQALQDLRMLLDVPVDADEPYRCETFVARLVSVRSEADVLRAATPGAAPPWLGLAVAASNEEIEHDIAADYRRNSWLSALLAAAAGGGMLLVTVFLTRSLRRMTAYAEKVAAGQEFDVELPDARGLDEIATLARAFRRMIEQVHLRTRELRESEARIRTILNTAAEGIVTIDEKGRLESFNQAAERIFGYPAAEVRGRHFGKLLYRGRPGDSGSSADDMPTLLGTSPLLGGSATASSLMSISRVNNTTRELVGRRRNGQAFPVEMSVSEVVLGDRLVYTAIMRDVTDRREAEAQIQKMTGELEQRVRERTAELVQANQSLEAARDLALEANRAKDTFLAVMSHELRTPLNAIIGYCDYWLKEAEAHDPNEMLDDLRKMNVSGRHLLTLINDVLDLAKIQAGRVVLDIGKFELHPLLAELEECVEPLVRKNCNELTVVVAPEIGPMRADRTRVRQVLLNLLSNAAKFTTAGVIWLEAERVEADGHHEVVFRVSDTGVGMKPEDVRRLFQPFVQVDSSNTRKHEGTGLGLAICRRLCELMGGSIEVQSAPGVGTTFTVRLPAAVVPVDRPGGRPAATLPPAGVPSEAGSGPDAP